MLVPVNRHVLVELPAENKGFTLPTGLTDSIQEGTVINHAADIKGDLADRLKIGVKVRWEKFAEADGSFDYTHDGTKVKAVLIKADQVMGVWE